MDDKSIEDACLIALGLGDDEVADGPAQEVLAHLREAACAMALAETPLRQPPASLKSRVLESLEDCLSGDSIGKVFGSGGDACVVTDLEGRVQWVNLAFTELCGYRVEELRGQKPGGVLQGPGTDPETVNRIRQAIKQQTFCAEEILNYDKDGQPYWAAISISPILGIDGKARAFVALERLIDRQADFAPI